MTVPAPRPEEGDTGEKRTALADLLRRCAEHWMVSDVGGMTTQTRCSCGWKSKRRLRPRKVDREADAHMAAVSGRSDDRD